MITGKTNEFWFCPKCNEPSGDAWVQCGNLCPIPGSVWFDLKEAQKYNNPIPYVTEGPKNESQSNNADVPQAFCY